MLEPDGGGGCEASYVFTLVHFLPVARASYSAKPQQIGGWGGGGYTKERSGGHARPAQRHTTPRHTTRHTWPVSKSHVPRPAQ